MCLEHTMSGRYVNVRFHLNYAKFNKDLTIQPLWRIQPSWTIQIHISNIAVYLYSVFQKKLVRSSSITLNTEQPGPKLKMILGAYSWLPNILKKLIIWKGVNALRSSCAQFSTIFDSEVCNFANMFAIRLTNGWKFDEWSCCY